MSKIVSVILPTFNEKNNIERFTNDVLEEEKNLPGFRVEVVIVDSHSTDGTLEIAKSLADKNPRIHFLEVGPGLGVALIEGHRYAIEKLKPDILAQMDADGQVSVDVLSKLIQAIDDGYDIALGSRFVKGGQNKLSFSRRIFSMGLSLVCRLIMGPINIGEFANSARAFTPELFKKINFKRLPWEERTFIIQPAFLHEAILAGAKYKEVPLIFKNRAEGYSKNKIINYTYDVFTYAIDARLHQLGLNIPFFYLSRRAKTMLKFGVVGFSGTLVDFIFYNLFISQLGIMPASAKGFSTEIAILNNFALNNFWTFKYRKTKTSLIQKLFIFNMVSLGGLAIAVVIVKFLHHLFGDGMAQVGPLQIAYYNLYFFATIPPVMIWNFTVNHYVTWKHDED